VTKNSEVLAEESKNELRTLAKAILKVDRLVPETLKKNLSLKVEFKDILKKTIRYIEFGIINKANKWNLIYSL
jgi:inositol 1,4,5-triphosphate receptor type 1/inositol 1,4,5-triphosphate receptor type 3